MNEQLAATKSVLTARELKDLKVLTQFTSVYCKVHHPGEKMPVRGVDAELGSLRFERYPVCQDCRDFLVYAFERRLRCPLEEKPTCKHCTVHCFKPGHREQVREIMRFSGQYLIKRGRFDLLWHYFF